MRVFLTVLLFAKHLMQLNTSAPMLSHVQLLVTLWTVAHQTPLLLGFSRQKYWSLLSFPPSWHLPNPRIEPTSSVSPALQADSLPIEPIKYLPTV